MTTRDGAPSHYSLHVMWASGREEWIAVPELGATVRLGDARDGEPMRIPVYRADGPTIAVCEVFGDEIPTIVAVDDSGDPDLDLTPLSIGFDPRVHRMSVVLPTSARRVRYDKAGETREAIGTTEDLVSILEMADYTVEVES